MTESFDARLQTKLNSLDHLDLRRDLTTTSGSSDRIIEEDHASYLNFSSNDYLGLAMDERLRQAHKQAAATHGTGSTGSRLISGNHPEYQSLERELAGWKDAPAALVFGSGYLTNLGVIRAVTTGRDLILYDELAHRCLIEGARLAEAEAKSFSHNDLTDLDQILSSAREDYDGVLILVEGIYSMDGDRAPLEGLLTCAETWDAWLLVDEAHSAGVWGREGGGLSLDCSRPPEISMGTCSKAMGGYGGYVCGSEALRDFLINRATSLIYSTGLPPSVIASNREALRVIRQDGDRRQRLQDHVDLIEQECSGRDIPLPDPPSQIIPLVTGSPTDTIEAGTILREKGIYGVPIRYPTVPRGQGRIRISLRSDHTNDDLKRLIEGIDRLDGKGLLTRDRPWETDG